MGINTINLEKIIKDYNLIISAEHSIDITRYNQKHFPLFFPNKGLDRLARNNINIHVYHECLKYNAIKQAVGEDTKVYIDNIGDSGQREYIFILNGSKYENNLTAEFRGVLGKNRLKEILLTLLITGVKPENIIFHDLKPNYDEIIYKDISFLENSELDAIILGGAAVFRRFLDNTKFQLLNEKNGNILSSKIYKISDKNILFTTFPYGDLCENAVVNIKKIGFEKIIFVGSCGYIGYDFKKHKLGDILAPNKIVALDGKNIVKNFENSFIYNYFNSTHSSVETIQDETLSFVNNLQSIGITSIDMEVYYLQKALEENYTRRDLEVGILNYITDFPCGGVPFSSIDYHSNPLIESRKQLFSKILEWICKKN